MSRTPRAFAAAIAALVAFHSAPPASAHDVFPLNLQLRPGSIGEFFVIDPSGCTASVTATSTNPGLVQIYAADMSKSTRVLLPGNGATVTVPDTAQQVFVVIAADDVVSAASATIEVCWIGSDVGKSTGNCMENSCSPYQPDVVTVLVDPFALDWGNLPFGLFFGDPVSTANGESFQQERADLAFGSRMPIVFARRYSSRFLTEGVGPGPLGRNWRHTLEWDLVRNGNYVEITAPDGRLLRFERGAFATAWTLEVGGDSPAELIDSGGGLELRDGRTDQIVTFDGNGRATTIEDGRGNSLTLAYTSGRLSSVSDGVGHVLTLTYTSGRITSISDGTRTVSYSYDASSRLMTVTDAAGGVTSYAYDGAAPTDALLATLTRPEGNVVQTQVYDAQKRVVQQTDALGSQGSLAYDGATGTTTTTDATLATQQHTYADRVPTALQLENGQSASSEYDSLGRRTRVTDRLGGRTSWTWDAASGRLATQTDADGGVTRWIRTARAAHGFTFHDLTGVEHPDGASEAFTYDANGNVLTRTDAAGNVWTRTYGANGEVLTLTDPAGETTTYAWNGDGTLASRSDPEGNTTTFVHDALGRLTEIHFPDANARSFVYDALDRVTATTDEAGQTTQYAYDDNGNLVAVLLPGGETWSFTYDAMDRVSGATDPEGGVASVGRDALGRITSVLDAAGRMVSFTWTSGGRLASFRDGHNQSTAVAYDAEDVPSGVTDATGNAWTQQTDAMGRTIRSISPAARERSVTRDRLGRVTRLVDGEGGRTDYGFDALGFPSSVQAAGSAAGFERDEAGRTTAFVRGDARWTLARDGAGRVIGETDPLGRSSSALLDSRGRPTHVDLPGGLGSADLTWSPDGLLERELWSDGVDLPYTYDANDRLLTAPGITLVRDANGEVVDCNGIVMTRDAAGRITRMDLAPGVFVLYTWDAAGLLTQVEDSDGNVMTFTYDAAQRLVGRVFPNGLIEARDYDADGLLARLLTTGPGPTTIADLRFERDDEGRIVTARRLQPALGTPAVGKTVRTYDAAGQDAAFTYDAMGRRTSDDEHEYTWDLAGRLIAAEDVAVSSTDYYAHGVEYTYGWNGAGNLDSLSWDGVTGQIDWNYGTERPSIARVSQDNVYVSWNVVLPQGGLLWANATDGSGATFHHEDERGNTCFTTNGLGSVVNAYAYDPFGKFIARTGPTATYPVTEYSLGAQRFAIQVGVGFSDGQSIYHMPSGATLQPSKPSESTLHPGWSPYTFATGTSTSWVGNRSAFRFDERRNTEYGTLRNYLVPQQPTTSIHSGSGWSSCGSCHPDGLTDSVSWTFASTPRSPIRFGAGGLAPVRVGSGFRPYSSYGRYDDDDEGGVPLVKVMETIRVLTAPPGPGPRLDLEEQQSIRRAVEKLKFFAFVRDWELRKLRGSAGPLVVAPPPRPFFGSLWTGDEGPLDAGDAFVLFAEILGHGTTQPGPQSPPAPGTTVTIPSDDDVAGTIRLRFSF